MFVFTSASLLRINKVSSISFAAMRLGTFEKVMKTNICKCHFKSAHTSFIKRFPFSDLMKSSIILQALSKKVAAAGLSMA